MTITMDASNMSQTDSATTDSIDTNMTTTDFAGQLQREMIAAKLSFNWLGTRKTVTHNQRDQAASAFAAAGDFLSVTKKLMDTSHPAMKRVTAIKSSVTAYWRGVTIPFPEPGIRLLPRNKIDQFDTQMLAFQIDLRMAVMKLDNHFDEIRGIAKEQLGSLYELRDYPLSLVDEFAVSHSYPSIEPPNYLQQLSPRLYEQECARMRGRFAEAVQLAEDAFTEEFSQLITNLVERLSVGEDGKAKKFQSSTVTNLSEFFERFKQLNVGNNQQLEQLVDQAKAVVAGKNPNQLRTSVLLREEVQQKLGSIQTTLGALMVDRPRRNLNRD